MTIDTPIAESSGMMRETTPERPVGDALDQEAERHRSGPPTIDAGATARHPAEPRAAHLVVTPSASSVNAAM